jgi:hypothetical protein
MDYFKVECFESLLSAVRAPLGELCVLSVVRNKHAPQRKRRFQDDRAAKADIATADIPDARHLISGESKQHMTCQSARHGVCFQSSFKRFGCKHPPIATRKPSLRLGMGTSRVWLTICPHASGA